MCARTDANRGSILLGLCGLQMLLKISHHAAAGLIPSPPLDVGL